MNRVVLSSHRTDWGTPPDLFERLHTKYQFDLDPAANHQNNLLPEYCTVEGHHLRRETYTITLDQNCGKGTDWGGRRVFLNPPYGRDISSWVMKAAEESQGTALVVALLPVRTGSRWWREWVVPYADIEYLPGRLKFVGADNSAPFDSAIARYR